MKYIVQALMEMDLSGDIASLGTSLPADTYEFPFPHFVGQENVSNSLLANSYNLIGINKSDHKGERFIGVGTQTTDGHVTKKVVDPKARENVLPTLGQARLLAGVIYQEVFS